MNQLVFNDSNRNCSAMVVDKYDWLGKIYQEVDEKTVVH